MNKPHMPNKGPMAFPTKTRGLNFFETDLNLQRLLQRRAPAVLVDHRERLADFGAWVGGALDEQAAYSDRYAPPRLESFGSDGEALGRVILNPDYSACHQEVYRRGTIGLAFGDEAAPHLLSFTMGYLLSHSDIAIHCPVTMTGAVAYVLDHYAPAAVKDAYLGEVTRMDGRTLSGGTWATELHGGSDVGATTTEARPDGEAWRLTGLKWFTSNAGSGLALATARPPGAPPGGKGLGCYLVPDLLADGTPNSLWVRRLKDKLGTRGLATGEIELKGTWALEVAAPPQGLKVMMEALAYSRIHNAMSACGVQRRALLEALCWCGNRRAFGGTIWTYPMVRDSLLDLVTEQEAGSAMAFEAAAVFDDAIADEARRPWSRVATALAKYKTAEQGVESARRALELVGGNGYTEEWPTARLYRDAMVLAVWEGPANVQALELMRMVAGKARGDEAFLERVTAVLEAAPASLEAAVAPLRAASTDCRQAFAYLRGNPPEVPRHARRLLELMSDCLAAALLVEEATHDLVAGDGRKALVAARYVARHFGGRAPIGPAPDPAQEQFEAIVNHHPVTL
jgi:alkylation response protein AidB-like acyl-CoA dehydrogenase